MQVKEVADSLGVKRSAIRKAIARGRLRATLVPGGRGGEHYDIEADAVDDYRRRTGRAGVEATEITERSGDDGTDGTASESSVATA